MKAVVLREFGGPQVLRAEDRAEPEVPDGWVAVDLHAAALNRHDCLVREGRHPIALPRVIGADGAGRRRDTGEAVVVVPSLHWGDGEFPAPGFTILGDHVDGTYGEVVAVPRENLRPVPAGFGWAEAAALPLAGLTAHRALFGRGGLRAGETVLVLGAGSGVGALAVSFAAIAGARVLVTSSSPERIARAVDLGAEDGVLRTDPAWPDLVREIAGEVDLVLDPAGATWPQALRTLRTGGRLVALGATAGRTAEVDVPGLYFGQHAILGTTMGGPRDVDAMLELVAGRPDWRPPVADVLPLERAADAHALLEAGEPFGKLVLDVA